MESMTLLNSRSNLRVAKRKVKTIYSADIHNVLQEESRSKAAWMLSCPSSGISFSCQHYIQRYRSNEVPDAAAKGTYGDNKVESLQRCQSHPTIAIRIHHPIHAWDLRKTMTFSGSAACTSTWGPYTRKKSILFALSIFPRGISTHYWNLLR